VSSTKKEDVNLKDVKHMKNRITAVECANLVIWLSITKRRENINNKSKLIKRIIN